MSHDRFIRIYDDVASPAYCQKLIDTFRQSPYVRPGQTQDADKVVHGFKVCDELFVREVLTVEKDAQQRTMWQAIDDELFAMMDPVFSSYNREFRHLDGQELIAEGFRFKRYPKGVGHFREHIDATPTTPTRVFALILYLNDVTEGGETEFPEQGVKVVPKTGRLAISPCTWTYPHLGHRPVSNDKYIVNNFLLLVPRRPATP